MWYVYVRVRTIDIFMRFLGLSARAIDSAVSLKPQRKNEMNFLFCYRGIGREDRNRVKEHSRNISASLSRKIGG